MAWGEPPCTCTPGNVVNGHQTWIIDPACPEHGSGNS